MCSSNVSIITETNFATTTESTKDPQNRFFVLHHHHHHHHHLFLLSSSSATQMSKLPPTNSLSLSPWHQLQKQKGNKRRKEHKRGGYKRRQKFRKAPNPQKFQNTQFPK
jgi:hypothetical protein